MDTQSLPRHTAGIAHHRMGDGDAFAENQAGLSSISMNASAPIFT